MRSAHSSSSEIISKSSTLHKENTMSEHIWTPSGTDITIRWRQAGWVPPSEQPEYQAKWKFWQERSEEHTV